MFALLSLTYGIVETTAMTLNAVLGFMALNQDFQDEMHEEVMGVMPTEADFVSSAYLRSCHNKRANLRPASDVR